MQHCSSLRRFFFDSVIFIDKKKVDNWLWAKSKFLWAKNNYSWGRAPVLAACDAGRRPALAGVAVVCVFFCESSPRQSPQEAPAAATSRAPVAVAVVDLFFAAAVPADGIRRDHVCIGIAGVEILQWGSCQKHIKKCTMLRHGK